MASRTTAKVHPVKLMRTGGTTYLRLPPAVLEKLGVSHFDFMVLTVVGDQLRARKVDFGNSLRRVKPGARRNEVSE